MVRDTPIAAPVYTGPPQDNRLRVALAVESMKRHMTDEGWQLTAGLGAAGYLLCGRDYKTPDPSSANVTIDAKTGKVLRHHGYNRHFWNLTDVPHVIDYLDPGVVFVQDKREWMGLTADRSRDPEMRFAYISSLADRPDIFKVGVIKDAQNDHALHVESAEEMGTHAWVTYYDLDRVTGLAPFLRRQHLIRTYHTVDKDVVPAYTHLDRPYISFLSGATGRAYPLRTRLANAVMHGKMPGTIYRKHPGYHRRGCATPDYLKLLSCFQVAICTASIYGYALRKIIEATAAGCIVVTDLPRTDVLPEIDGNLARIPSDSTPEFVTEVCHRCSMSYDADRQRMYAEKAKLYYDYREAGRRLANDIEMMRRAY